MHGYYISIMLFLIFIFLFIIAGFKVITDNQSIIIKQQTEILQKLEGGR